MTVELATYTLMDVYFFKLEVLVYSYDDKRLPR